MNNKVCLTLAVIVGLSGCATGQEYAANVYTAGQVNSRQAAKTVEILAVLPAKVQVDNSRNKKIAMVAGGILGAIAGGMIGGSMGHGQYVHQNNAVIGVAGGAVGGTAAGSLVADTTLVNGVSIAYRDEGQVFNSAQVGQSCEFKPGTAIMIATSTTETRIQPNAACPVQQ